MAGSAEWHGKWTQVAKGRWPQGPQMAQEVAPGGGATRCRWHVVDGRASGRRWQVDGDGRWQGKWTEVAGGRASGTR